MRAFMNVLLVLALIGGVIVGFGAMSEARSAVQEIEGLIGLLIATCAAAGMGIMSAVDEATKRLPAPVVVAKVVAVADAK